MSRESGKHRGSVIGIRTNQPGEKNRLTIMFELEGKYNEDGELMTLRENVETLACVNYYLTKDIKPGNKSSAFDVSIKKFERHWGTSLLEYNSLEDGTLEKEIIGKQRDLKLKASEYKNHDVDDVRVVGEKSAGVTQNTGMKLSDML